MRAGTFPRRLIEGYASFKKNRLQHEAQRFKVLSQTGQRTDTLVVCCCDSRAAPEIIFDAAPGQLFVVRNVANLVPPYDPDGNFHGTSAAVEFAVKGLKVRNIVVMGHGLCGGVAGFLNPAALRVSGEDFLVKWMTLLDPAYQRIRSRRSLDNITALSVSDSSQKKSITSSSKDEVETTTTTTTTSSVQEDEGGGDVVASPLFPLIERVVVEVTLNEDRPGMLSEMTAAIAKAEGDIVNAMIETQSNVFLVRCTKTTTTYSERAVMQQLKRLRHNLMSVKGVSKVSILLPEPDLAREKQKQLELESVVCSLENLRTFPLIRDLTEIGELNLYGAWFDISTAELLTFDTKANAWSLV